MPPKKYQQSKQQLPSVMTVIEAENENVDEEDRGTCKGEVDRVDVQYNPDIIAGLLSELNQRVESRCAQIRGNADYMVLELQQQFQDELFKLPTDIKKMSMSKFREKFGDILDLAPSSSKPRTNLSIQPSSTSQSASSRVFQTPFTSKENATVRRAPVEGERILSTNGSPLGEFTTAQKASRPNNEFVPQTPAGVYVPLRTGEVIDIQNTDFDTMDKDAKADALAKVQEMMAKMQQLMGKLQD